MAVSEIRQLTNSEWESLRGLVHETTGIALSNHKKVLLASRLGSRLKELQLASFREYYKRLTVGDPAGTERQAFINAITTNKTHFYREPNHFEVLSNWLKSNEPAIAEARARGLRIWCAAASTGEEPYTIADVVRTNVSSADWNRTTIVASDVDTRVLAKAQEATYDIEPLAELAEPVRRRMFVKVSSPGQTKLQVQADLREHVKFTQLNLIEPTWAIQGPFDIVFCRNVLIYFDRSTQLDVVRRLCARLEPHGLLFLGHSEGLAGMELKLETVAHTVYKTTKESQSHRIYENPAPRAAFATSTALQQPASKTRDPSRRWARVVLDGQILLVIALGDPPSTKLGLVKDPSVLASDAGYSALLRHLNALKGEPKRRVTARVISSAPLSEPTLDRIRQALNESGIAIHSEKALSTGSEVVIELNSGKVYARRQRTAQAQLNTTTARLSPLMRGQTGES